MADILLKIPIDAVRDLLRAARLVTDEHDHPTTTRRPPNDELEPRLWSGAQRRLIYRLTYQLGYEGEGATSYIRTALRLDGPDDQPSSLDASRLIDRLKSEVGSNGKGHGRAGT